MRRRLLVATLTLSSLVGALLSIPPAGASVPPELVDYVVNVFTLPPLWSGIQGLEEGVDGSVYWTSTEGPSCCLTRVGQVDEYGDQIWASTVPQAAAGGALAVSLLHDRVYVATGPEGGGEDLHVFAYELDGTYLWEATVGWSEREYCTGVVADPAGHVFCIGRTESPEVPGGGNAVVASWDKDGDFRFANSLSDFSAAGVVWWRPRFGVTGAWALVPD
jgi:hypothetical protein